MEFELFDRDAAIPGGDAAPMVRVSRTGRLVFNRPAAAFLADQYGAGLSPQVALLFSAETRTVGVRPLGEQEVARIPVGSRWAVVVQRSVEWPVGVGAPEFVEHYRIGDGESAAVLVRGPGPRMLTFVALRCRSGSSGRGLAVAGRRR